MYQVYKITNKENGRFYIGVHKGDVFNDNYYGSGKLIRQAINKYGKDSFTRTIISEHISEKEAYQKESKILTDTDIKERKCYNITEGGGNPPTFIGESHPGSIFTDKQRKEICKKYLDGEATTLLAEEYNTTKSSICYVLESNDIERRHRNDYEFPTGKAHQNWIDKDEYKICQRYKAGETTYQIANNLGCHPVTIENVLKRNSVKIRGHKKAVLQFLPNGIFVSSYPSATDASKITGVSRSGISSTCANYQLSSGGYKWRYVNYA